MVCWWLACARTKICKWIASFGYFYHSDVLQYPHTTAALAAAAKNDIMTAHASRKQSCHGVKHYQHYQCGNALLLCRLTVLPSFVHERELVVACAFA
jgi:hypothetical protein